MSLKESNTEGNASGQAASSPSSSSSSSSTPLFVDIGANLLDEMYQGVYRSKSRHEPDLDLVLQRAWSNNVDKIIITAGNYTESQKALRLARRHPNTFSTVGVHPTRCDEFGSNPHDVRSHLAKLRRLIRDGLRDGTVVALGELGLDYDRTEFCSKEQQHLGFKAQLTLAREFPQLPLFIHNRNTSMDLFRLLQQHQADFNATEEASRTGVNGGVVHSFDDSAELATKLVQELNFYIGINGCSLKTPQNLQVVRNAVPLDRMLLETDCPWCDIRTTHASYPYVQTHFTNRTKKEKQFRRGCFVKNRSEPCHIVQIAQVVAGVKGLPLKDVADVTRNNAYDLFGGFQKKIADK